MIERSSISRRLLQKVRDVRSPRCAIKLPTSRTVAAARTSQGAGRQLLFVAKTSRGEALATLVVNTIRGIVKARRQGAGLRRSSQGHVAGHRGTDGRQGHFR